MNKNLKFLLIGLLGTIFFIWGVNVLEKSLKEAFWGQEMTQNPRVLVAQINQEVLENKLKSLKPFQVQNEGLELEAKGAVSLLVREGLGSDKILFEKNIDRPLAIASLTKLMTAYVVLKYYDLDQLIEISKEAVEEEGELGNLKIGEIFKVKDLLYLLLMESSNDAAEALSQVSGKTKFLELMNDEAQKIGLQNTYFFNPSGLDPDLISEPANYSTARDLVNFTKFLLKESLVWDFLSTPEFDLYSPDGVFHHKLLNSNKLLINPGWRTKIKAGKTGWTPRAGGCLILVLEAPKGQGWLINVILGSGDRFEEMKKLIDWIYQSYKW